MSVEHRTYRVQTIGSTDAPAAAKRLAKADGCKVRTVARIDLVEANGDPHKTIGT